MNATTARTASGKEQALVEFIDQLGRDGMTVTDLAELARVGRSHLEQMLHGHRAGRCTWRHIIPLLSNDAVFLLEQCSAWNKHAAEAMTLTQYRALRARKGAAA